MVPSAVWLLTSPAAAQTMVTHTEPKPTRREESEPRNELALVLGGLGGIPPRQGLEALHRPGVECKLEVQS